MHYKLIEFTSIILAHIHIHDRDLNLGLLSPEPSALYIELWTATKLIQTNKNKMGVKEMEQVWKE